MRLYLLLLLFAGAIYIGCMVSPPSLMDDVDGVQAQIAHNMLTSGDWVTARLAGVPYLEKAPLIYWLIAICYKILGVHDWVARIPMVLAALLLALVTAAFGNWAFNRRAGFYAGLCVSTCVGLFLFTRILIPDVMLTGNIALSMWAFLRAIDSEEKHPRVWAFVLAASIGVSLLYKSLIGVVFPVAGCLIYLGITGQLLLAETWKRIRPFSGLAIALLIAAPWHILAALRNPPYFDFTFHSGPGEYHGFLWFFFMNEQVLRFLNMRYPRDYDTVPRLWFWLFHLLWLFPWSVYLPAAFRFAGFKASYRPVDRAEKTRLLALCWAGFILVFFTFSTTQEYYSMPCYPALALLIGSAMDADGVWVKRGTRVLSVILACAALVCFGLWFAVRNLPTPGDISDALSQHPGAYTLSLGHMGDLTIPAFAYLRAPLLLAAFACLIGAVGTMWAIGQKARHSPTDPSLKPALKNLSPAYLSAALMAVLFFQAARMAMVVFDPYMSSRPLAEALLKAPKGRLILDHHYYTYSSVIFYADPVYPERETLLLNGRFNNLVYGSYAPGAPDVFLDDPQWARMWKSADRFYLAAMPAALPRLQHLVGADALITVISSGGKLLLTNLPLPTTLPISSGNLK